MNCKTTKTNLHIIVCLGKPGIKDGRGNVEESVIV